MMRDAKSAVVTGASGMIGVATVKRLRDMGCSILAVDINESISSHVGVTSFTADVTDAAQIESVVAAARQLFGHVDALVHIAGGAGPTKAPSLEATDLSVWQQVMALNATSAFLLSRALVPAMRKARFGRVVLLSSILARGEKGPPATVSARLAYAAAKAALEGFKAQLAKDCAADGVTVNAVAPGLILGETGTRIRDRFDALPETERARVLAAIPAGRPGSADEIAAIIAFLLTGAAGYINGATIAADGAAS